MTIRGYLWILTSVGIMGLTGGCTLFTSQPIPDWVEGYNQTFPNDQFLVGRGEAETRDLAEQRAYAAVARIFNAKVKAQMEDNEIYSQLKEDTKTTTTRQVRLDHFTHVTTEKVLEDVRVLDTWHRPEDEQYFALAGLNREKTERMLLERISAYDRAVTINLEDGRKGSNALTRLRALKRAMRDLQLRELVNADLQIIRLTGKGVPSLSTAATIQRELNEFLLNDLLIHVSITGEHQAQIQQAVWEGLNQEGLVTFDQDPNTSTQQDAAPNVELRNPDLLITGNARLDDLHLFDPHFKYVRWCSDLQIVEPHGQRVIGVVSRSGREGHITQQEARVRATHAMQDAVSTEIAQSIAHYIYDDEHSAQSSSSSCPPQK